MKYNRLIYHCISCGAIKRTEPDEVAPACCGTKMVQAAAETVADHAEHRPEEEPRSVADRPSAGGSTVK